ncbi:DNA helicase Pif1 like protein, partial [Pisolithus tinctorius]
VPVNDNNEMLILSIHPGTPHAELTKTASLIIWDEAPMANKAVLSCVDNICRQIMGCDSPFRGKAIILLGDFCQTCPVIPGGSHVQVV